MGIDEIQRIPELLTVVHAVLEEPAPPRYSIFEFLKGWCTLYPCLRGFDRQSRMAFESAVAGSA